MPARCRRYAAGEKIEFGCGFAALLFLSFPAVR
jgi:hypothetical protein